MGNIEASSPVRKSASNSPNVITGGMTAFTVSSARSFSFWSFFTIGSMYSSDSSTSTGMTMYSST
jgi:hypothetical protein